MPDMRRKENRRPVKMNPVLGLAMMTGLNITLLPRLQAIEERLTEIEKELGINESSNNV